jgi:uncharacterized protein with GYD domain
VPTYIALINWTDQGIRGYRETVDRVAHAEPALERFGVRIKDVHWTVGPYDIVVSLDAPDEETVTAGMLALGAQGNVRTTTMRAFDRDEMRAIVERAEG